MVENTSRENSAVVKPGWGAIRWADLTVSDASNSWLCTQSETKNESKSLGLTSLLQKNVKINDVINENASSKENGFKDNKENRKFIRGFLTKKSSTNELSINHEKLRLSISRSIDKDVSQESSEAIENSQELESLEFKFGEEIVDNKDENLNKIPISSLIQSANLNAPKVFGNCSENFLNKHFKDSDLNKKRHKNYIEEHSLVDNCNNYQVTEQINCKKVKHIKTNTNHEMDKARITEETIGFSTQINSESTNLKKKIPKVQCTPKRVVISNKSSTMETPKTPQLCRNVQNANCNKSDDLSIENSSNLNVDWNKRISSRLFQIAIGKGTRAYQNYLKIKPKREDREQNDPQTPNAHARCPQKQFTDQLNHWRKSLHQYDDLDI